MNELNDIAARTHRFNDAVRGYTPPSPSRHAKLMPFKDGIVALRQKGGSLRVIRELLATINVAVGTDTIALFIAEVTGQPARPRTSGQRRRKRPADIGVTCVQPTAAPTLAVPRNVTAPQLSPPNPTSVRAPINDTAAEHSRTRGPRIADPRNL